MTRKPRAILNRAMAQKIRDREALDLSGYAKEGQFYILDHFVEDIDYCDSEKQTWIWSIGRRKSDGKILASMVTDLYENPDFECLWLR